VQQVIQTASAVVDGRLTPREAVTILATMTRDALPAARLLRQQEPDVAEAYRQLIVAVGRELRRQEPTSDEPRYLRALTEDLANLHQALG